MFVCFSLATIALLWNGTHRSVCGTLRCEERYLSACHTTSSREEKACFTHMFTHKNAVSDQQNTISGCDEKEASHRVVPSSFPSSSGSGWQLHVVWGRGPLEPTYWWGRGQVTFHVSFGSFLCIYLYESNRHQSQFQASLPLENSQRLFYLFR